MKHLYCDDNKTWCDDYTDAHTTHDPRDATCAECLREAATYGAAAAMRCAAVEAGASRDPELIAERDEAIKQLGELRAELQRNGYFVCVGCSHLWRAEGAGLTVGAMAWCFSCTPETVQ